MARIDNIRSKINRAEKHIRDLDAAIASFIELPPYTIGTKPHFVEEIKHTTLYVASVQSIPIDIPLLIGDAIHNLRSALEHLMWQLIEAAGGTPDENTSFPIAWGTEGRQIYLSRMGNREIQKISSVAQNIMEKVQPYYSGDDTLRKIQELNIWDKHRLPVVTAIGYEGWNIALGLGNVTFKNFGAGATVSLKANQEIASIPTSTYERHLHEDFKLAVQITFREPQILNGEPVLGALDHFANFVNALVNSLEPFLV
jgi:hypothetical protein